MAGEKDHDLLDPAVVLPRLADPFERRRSDAVDLEQPLGLVFEDVESVEPEGLHHRLRPFGAQPLDLAGAEVAPEALEG